MTCPVGSDCLNTTQRLWHEYLKADPEPDAEPDPVRDKAWFAYLDAYEAWKAHRKGCRTCTSTT